MVRKPRLVRTRSGKFIWVWPDGEFVPFIGGGAPDPDDDDEGDKDGDPDDDDPDDDDHEDDEKKFTQSDVDRFVAKEKRKARRSLEREIVEKLGVSIDDAATTLKKIAEGAKPEELQKLTDRERQLDGREKKLAERETELTVRAKLQEAGVNPKRLKRAARLVDLDEDFDDEDITTAIDELKDEMPELFGGGKDDKDDDGAPPRRPPSSTPRRTPRTPKSPPKDDSFAAGADRAKQFMGVV